MKGKTVLLMIVSTLAFAVVNALVKYLEEYGEFQLVFFRCIVSLLISLIQLKALRISVWGNNKLILITRGFAGVLALIMGFALIKNIPLGTAVMLIYLSPIFTALIAVYWLKERVRSIQWFYLLVCVFGVFVLKKGEISLTFEMLLLGFGASSIAGLAYNCVRVCRKTDHPLVVVFYFPLIGAPVAFVLIFLFQEWIWPTTFDWFLIIALGGFTQIAQIALTKALQGDKAANAMVLKYLGVIHAFFIGWFFFDEGITAISAFGVLIILLGIVLFSWKTQQKKDRII
ncbi:MAG: EamA family transporter [Flavobacteriales bacterium]|nr:EamA family transporter [Flavobacteriales bacterium]|tara:strand:+ start:160 stop:1017 length:858 start_codon:yes stop_codon:yes gene_type:complete